MTQRSALTTSPVIPWRAIGERFASPILVVAALALLVIGKIDRPAIDQVRTRAVDALAPALSLAQQPLAHLRAATGVAREMLDLANENARLKEENRRLTAWQATALKLDAQNQVLRGMLKLAPDAPVVLRTEPVIGEPGGVYVRSLLIAGGARDGLGRGQAAMVGPNLIGRITELGNWSARVLLLTDLNSRIPVILEGTRTHAILAGDNSPKPKLLYLPRAAAVNVGDRLVTAGHDGVFPRGLLVGRVASVDGGEIRVEPAADLERIEFVQIVDSAAQSALTPEEGPADGRFTFGPP